MGPIGEWGLFYFRKLGHLHLRKFEQVEPIRNLKVIAFDADDTLWVNEPYFQEIERKFCEMMEVYHPQHTVSRELLSMELSNLEHYGYGIKSFILSMIEAAINISGRTIKLEVIEKIIRYGKEMLHKPIELLDGVEQVLISLNGRYRLVMTTKGDLLDQERKLVRSDPVWKSTFIILRSCQIKKKRITKS